MKFNRGDEKVINDKKVYILDTLDIDGNNYVYCQEMENDEVVQRFYIYQYNLDNDDLKPIVDEDELKNLCEKFANNIMKDL